MKFYLFAFIAGLGISAVYFNMQLKKEIAAKTVVIQQNNGFTKYRDFLAYGKAEISQKKRFIGAEVERQDVFTRRITKKQSVFNSDATVAISYTGIYAFGWELNSENYDIQSVGNSLVLTLHEKPKLLSQPATKNPKHDIPSTGWLIDEDKALTELFEGLDQRVLAEGKKMEREEAIIALCEKNLAAFLLEFLTKQGGVNYVPNIVIKYGPISRDESEQKRAIFNDNKF